LGGLLIEQRGRPNGIVLPIFIKGLSKISSIVSLREGSGTRIFFIKSNAYGGA